VAQNQGQDQISHDKVLFSVVLFRALFGFLTLFKRLVRVEILMRY
jgi:hypothetical protein